jgi:hypothetical protein
MPINGSACSTIRIKSEMVKMFAKLMSLSSRKVLEMGSTRKVNVILMGEEARILMSSVRSSFPWISKTVIVESMVSPAFVARSLGPMGALSVEDDLENNGEHRIKTLSQKWSVPLDEHAIALRKPYRSTYVSYDTNYIGSLSRTPSMSKLSLALASTRSLPSQSEKLLNKKLIESVKAISESLQSLPIAMSQPEPDKGPAKVGTKHVKINISRTKNMDLYEAHAPKDKQQGKSQSQSKGKTPETSKAGGAGEWSRVKPVSKFGKDDKITAEKVFMGGIVKSLMQMRGDLDGVKKTIFERIKEFQSFARVSVAAGGDHPDAKQHVKTIESCAVKLNWLVDALSKIATMEIESLSLCMALPSAFGACGKWEENMSSASAIFNV